MKANGEFKIEKGIPAPASRARSSSALRDTLRKMQPGESVLVPSENRSGIAGDMTQIWGRGNGTSRKEEGGVRIWRLK